MPNSNSPTISVIITCYNQADLLPSALESALRQTHPCTEIIIVDDGSTDATPMVLHEFQTRASTIPLTLVRQKNRGVAAARNAGAAKSHGEFLIFLDGDDELLPTYVEKTLQAIAYYPVAGYVYTHYQYFGAANKNVYSHTFNGRKLLFQNYITVTCLLRRTLFELVGGFNSQLNTVGYEDWDFFLNALEQKQYGVLLPEVLFRYRQHASSRNQYASTTSRALRTIRRLHPKLFGVWYYLGYYSRVFKAILIHRPTT